MSFEGTTYWLVSSEQWQNWYVYMQDNDVHICNNNLRWQWGYVPLYFVFRNFSALIQLYYISTTWIYIQIVMNGGE